MKKFGFGTMRLPLIDSQDKKFHRYGRVKENGR